MSKDQLFVMKMAAWVVVTALCWLYAAKGYSSTPRFDMWFWGVFFVIDAITFVASAAMLALGL